MRTRAFRRHHKNRMKERAKMVLKNLYSSNEDEKIHENPSIVGIHADNLAICSCPMCCNERSNPWNSGAFLFSMPERRANASFKDQMEEVYG